MQVASKQAWSLPGHRAGGLGAGSQRVAVSVTSVSTHPRRVGRHYWAGAAGRARAARTRRADPPVVTASARPAAGPGDRIVVELAQPLHAVVKPAQIPAGAGDFVVQLVEPPGHHLVDGHRPGSPGRGRFAKSAYALPPPTSGRPRCDDRRTRTPMGFSCQGAVVA